MLDKVNLFSGISAGAASQSRGVVVFSNSNGVSFGLNGNTVTGSVAPGGVALSAGSQSVNTGTVSFANSNGITFGMSNSNQITASYTVPGATVFSNSNNVSFGLNGSTITATASVATSLTNINVSAGAASNNLSAITFSNSNGVSFGLNGSTLTATVATNYQSQGAYLTTADLSQNSSKYVQNWKLTGNTAGTTSSAQGTDLWMAGGNGVTISGSSNTLSFSVANQSVQTQNCVDVTLSGNSTSAGAGYILISSGTMVLAGGNNITLSQNGQSVTISGPNAGGAQTGISGIVVSNTTYNSGTVSFSNANGISFGSSAGQAITASYTVPVVTNSSWTVSDTVTSATVGRLAFTAANGITMTLSTSNNGNHTVFASYTVPTVTNSSWTVSDAATSGTVARLAFTNLNGVTLSLSTGAGGSHTIVGSVVTNYLTTADLSANSSNYFRNWKLTGNTAGTTSSQQGTDFWLAGGNGVTVSGSSNTISFSVATNYQSQGAYLTTADLSQNSSKYVQNWKLTGNTAGTTSSAQGTDLWFSGANNITVSGNSNTIAISAAAQTNQTGNVYASSNTFSSTSGTYDARSLSIAGSGAVSVAATNSGWIVSAPVQTNQAGSVYAVGNTSGTSSGTYDARTLSISAAGVLSIAASNSGWILSVPASSQSLGMATSTAGGATGGTSNTVSGAQISYGFYAGSNITLSQSANGASGSLSIYAPAPGAAAYSIGVSTGGNTAGNTGVTGTRIVFVGTNAISLSQATDATGATISINFTQSNQTLSFAATSNTAGNTSGMSVDARSLTIAGYGAVSVGFSTSAGGSSVVVSAATQTNQTGNVYASSNTTVSTNGTYDARSLSMAGAGAISIQASNSGWIVSSPVTSSLSATGWASISTNGSTISIGASYTGNVYAVGNTFSTSSGTADPRTLSISGISGIQVAASNSGWVVGNQAISVYEPFPILTGTAFSSHAPASWWFNRFVLPDPLAVSNINVVKSLNAAIPTDTLASSGRNAISYSHGVTIFSRQNYGAQSTNLTTVATASMGFTASISYTSISQSVAYSWVTNTAGGTTSFSTTSSNGNWSNYFTGTMIFPIPCVTTLVDGEYFIAHAHSTTTGTTGNSNFTLVSFSNLHIAPQVVNVGVLGSSGTQASMNPWGAGVGIASAVTTNNSMPMSVISGATVNNFYFAASNV